MPTHVARVLLGLLISVDDVRDILVPAPRDVPCACSEISSYQHQTIVAINRRDKPKLKAFRAKHRGK